MFEKGRRIISLTGDVIPPAEAVVEIERRPWSVEENVTLQLGLGSVCSL
jgi:hypothetical protein